MASEFVNLAQYGRLLRAARILAGYDRVDDASKGVEEDTGVPISPRTLYALERGEQSPSLEQFLALTMHYDPPSGWSYWQKAYSEKFLEYEGRARQVSNREG